MGTMTKFLLGLPFNVRQRRLAASRSQIGKDQFVAQILAQGGDERAAELTWDALMSGWVAEGLTPYPDDNLEAIYGIAEEELDEDLILRILSDIGAPIPTQEFVRRFGAIDSPLRIAQFVRECRREGS